MIRPFSSSEIHASSGKAARDNPFDARPAHSTRTQAGGVEGFPISRAGKETRNVLPFPTSVSTSIFPECSFTIFSQIARPNPVPSPVFLVVKKGSNILFLDSSVIPIPLSEIEIFSQFPFCDGREGRSC